MPFADNAGLVAGLLEPFGEGDFVTVNVSALDGGVEIEDAAAFLDWYEPAFLMELGTDTSA